MGDYLRMAFNKNTLGTLVVGVIAIIIFAAFAVVAHDPQYNLSALTLTVLDFLPVGMAIALLILVFKN